MTDTKKDDASTAHDKPTKPRAKKAKVIKDSDKVLVENAKGYQLEVGGWYYNANKDKLTLVK